MCHPKTTASLPLSPPPPPQDAYRDDMKSFSSIDDLTLLGADTIEQLQLLERSASCAVVWGDYTGLNSSSLYQESFVGVQELVDFIQEMVRVY